jgi:thiol:disulfide interchange protein DsbD
MLVSLAAPMLHGEEPVQIRLFWSSSQLNSPLHLGAEFDIAEGWHINADPPQAKTLGDFSPFATRVGVVDMPQGWQSSAAVFPKAHEVRVDYAEGGLLSFDGKTQATITFIPNGKASSPLRLSLAYQACDDRICSIPVRQELEVALPGAAGAPTVDPERFKDLSSTPSSQVDFDLFELNFSIDTGSKAGLAMFMLVAAIGGLLLNFTPCVLPVIPLKMIALSKSSGSRGKCFFLGTIMSCGVVGFWVALGLAILSLSSISSTNQLYQNPFFTLGVGVVIAVMALGMGGLFDIKLPNGVYAISPKHDRWDGAFGFGIMTAVLSTPCTAPLMGAAAAWATTQPLWITLFTFLSIGCGMALPYLILSAFPNLVAKMPKTGPASLLIKQVMGILMLSAAAYFVGTGLHTLFSDPLSPSQPNYWWAVGFFMAIAGLWLAYKTIRITRSPVKRFVFVGLGFLLVSAGYGLGENLTRKPPINWVPYSPAAFERAREDSKLIVIDFTAEWCINCKTLEHTVLAAENVVKALNHEAVVPFKVDLTGDNPDGRELLKQVGRVAIPLLLVYNHHGNEVFKQDFYTAPQLDRLFLDHLANQY